MKTLTKILLAIQILAIIVLLSGDIFTPERVVLEGSKFRKHQPEKPPFPQEGFPYYWNLPGHPKIYDC